MLTSSTTVRWPASAQARQGATTRESVRLWRQTQE